MSARASYWLRPTPCRHGEVRWHVIEASGRPTPDCMGPFGTVGEAVAAAEPDGLAESCEDHALYAPTG